MNHYYFEKYECLDGEGKYNILSLSQSERPYDERANDWLRELIEFAVSTNDEKPWSEKKIKDWLASDDQSLDVYGGTRIYRDFVLREISKAEHDVLCRFI